MEKKTNEKNYDLIIIGAGPAGLTAGIYAGRYLIKTLILGEVPGGTITEAHEICNFPSEKEIKGFKLGEKMVSHTKKLGIELKQERVEKIEKQDKKFKIKTNKEEYYSKKIILAIGRERQTLNVLGAKEFLGKGVSYCATCDAAFYKGKFVAVIGGSNAALTAALLLSEYAKKVYIIYRKEKFFRAEPSWVKKIGENKKIKTILNSEVARINGKERVEGVVLNTGEVLKVQGVFIEIGSIPNEDFSKHLGLKTEKGYIRVNKNQETNVEGIYAAGDITNNPLKQIITACAEGAIAASSAYHELIKENENN